MSGDSPGPYLAVVLLVAAAAGLTAVEAALSTFSRAHAARARARAASGSQAAGAAPRRRPAAPQRGAVPAHPGRDRGHRAGHRDRPRRARHRAVDVGAGGDRRHVRRAVRVRRRRPAHAGATALRAGRADHGGRRAGGRPGCSVRCPGADPGRQRADAGQGLLRRAVLLRGRAARDGRPGRGLQPDRVRRAADDPLGLRARRHLGARGDGAAHRPRLHRAGQDAAPGDVAVPAQRLLPGARSSRTTSTTSSASPTSRTSPSASSTATPRSRRRRSSR